MKGQTVLGALYRNHHNGTFTDVTKQAGLTTPCVAMGDAVGDNDFNNAGRPDICVGNDSTPNFLDRDLGDGKFCDASQEAGPAIEARRVGRGLAVGDLFNDGKMDVVVEDLDGKPLILRNPGVAGRQQRQHDRLQPVPVG